MLLNDIFINKKKIKKTNLIKYMSKEIVQICLMLIPPIILLLLWQWAGNKGYIDYAIMPTPSKIVSTFFDLIQKGKLQTNLMVSGLRILKGFCVGTCVGIILGISMGIIKPLEKSMTILIGLLRPIPIIAWIPLFILWLGLGETSKTVIIAIGCFWPTLLNTIRGIKNTSEKLLEVARILEKSNIEILFKVIFPSALPSILTGIRLGVGASCMGVVGAEMLGAGSGIGFLITYGRQLAQPALMMVGVLIVGLFGLFMDFVLLKIESVILKWDR